MTPLEISEERYRRLFEGAKDGIFILDVNTLKIVDANPYIQEFLGYSKDELQGKELWEIGLFKDQAASQQTYEELQQHGYVRYDDLPLQTKDGNSRDVEFVSNVYAEGSTSVIQCNIRDISERKTLEGQRERLIQAEKLKLLGQMARGVSHDLNQSLGLISGYGDLAIAAVSATTFDRAALLDMLETIAQAATDGGQIVSRLLTFARGQPEGPAEEVSLAEVLDRVGSLTAPRWRDAAQADGRMIALYVDAEPDAIILGWAASIREALVNLVFNAVDALPQGGVIRLRANRLGETIRLEVQDSGIGMSAKVKAQVFEPLFTTKGSHGTGLGLAQVSSMVEQHHGQIAVESTPGVGTTFSIDFPAANGSLAHVPGRANGRTILVVDDEPALAKLISRMLRLVGQTVVEVHSGAEALEHLATESFDVMISDMGMPNMDGWELTRQVRARYPRVSIIIASGWGSQITDDEARERGITAVISKPYRLVDLQQALATLDAAPALRLLSSELTA